jgi:outer membrane protein OmpA-like peptidoglycan-associated protein
MKAFVASVALLTAVVMWRATSSAQGTTETAQRTDYLTFAQGAVPVSVGGAGAPLGASLEKAIRAVDGDPSGFVLTLKPGSETLDTEFVYELPAPTVFDRFAVPNVLETPSPGETFTREVEVHGSAAGPVDGFVLLASGVLTTHRARGQVTELVVRSKTAVRWVKLRLRGGIQVLRPESFFEFSEIIGNGSQQAPALSDRFKGVWKGRGVLVELRQDGAIVSGCYDQDGELKGTVTGNVLTALGVDRSDRVPSAFILSVRDDGTLLGVRSSNRAPFAVYTGDPAPAGSGPSCPPTPPAVLGCGAVIHGINFDFDSATIRPDSESVLSKLFDGLKGDPSSAVVIEGHTSNEGTDQYNLGLSGRRAQAVVADLVKRGIPGSRLSAVGVGEKQPIAGNSDESGRSLNRRVEVHCR